MNRTTVTESSYILLLVLLSGLAFNTISPEGIPVFYHAVETTPEQFLEVDQVAAIIAARRALLIDTRSPEEYAAGYLPGAINIPGYAPVDRIMAGLKGIPKDKMLVVYCAGIPCPFADRLAGFLRFQEYTSVYVFPGGVEAWQAAGKDLSGR